MYITDSSAGTKKKKHETYLISNFTSEDIYKLLEEVSADENESDSEFDDENLRTEILVPQPTEANPVPHFSQSEPGTSSSFFPSSPPIYQTLTPVILSFPSESVQIETESPDIPDIPPPVTLSEVSQHLLSTSVSDYDTPEPFESESPQPLDSQSHSRAIPATSTSLPPWSSTAPQLPKISFSGSHKLMCDPQGHDPIDFFNLYFTDDFLQLVVRETNAFAEALFLRGATERSRITDWKELDLAELKIFLGIVFLMGIIKLNRINDYWNTGEMFSFHYISSRMSRDRFLNIRQAFHLARNPVAGDPIVDPLYKIRPLLDHFHQRTEDVVYPNKELCIDESMSPWRGRISFRQYIPQKRHKYGIKLYMLTEPNGLIHRFLIYAGSRDPDVSGQGHTAKVVHKLVNDFKGSGHSLYMDRYYNSVPLARELKDQKVLLSGTLRSDRKETPREIVTAKLKKGEMVQRWSPEGISVCKWKDKREVLMISSEHSGEMINTSNRRNENITKPEVVVYYNKNMGGVDRVDQLLSYYSSDHRSLKWYKKLSFHIMEMMMLNSYFLYRSFSNVTKRVDLYHFRIQIISTLCGPRRLPFVRPRSPLLMNRTHYATQHPPAGNSTRKKQQRCKSCQKKTTWYCPDCEGCPGVCQAKECFLAFHEKNGFQLI